MTVYRFVIEGPPVVLKNRKQIVSIGGKPRLISSSKARRWIDDAVMQLRTQWAGRSPIAAMVNARITSYLPTRRKTDASNLYQAPEDALQAAGVLLDDWQIESHDGSRRSYDKERPRVEIELTEVGACDE